MTTFSDCCEHTSKTVLDAVPFPRIGYLGAINQKIDFSLLLNLALSRPSWSFVLLGPELQENWEHNKINSFAKIKKLSNIHILPPLPFDKIPSAMGKIDIGIIPYDLTSHAGYSESPLKMYQYWACKKPIVSVPLPNLKDQPGILSIGATPEEWIKAIEWELNHDSPDLRERRFIVAEENSWSVRAKQVISVIRQMYFK